VRWSTLYPRGHWRILIRRTEATTLNRQRIRLFARVLSIALLAAQFGAEAHAFSHLRTDTHGTPNTTQCATCLSFAPVTAGVGASAKLVVSDSCMLGLAPVIPAATFSTQSPLASYQARAPPLFL
jgi:hypothetical protein